MSSAHPASCEARHRLVLMHPLDPRGRKIGGIENHVRLVLEHAPRNWDVLFVGVDGVGDCRLGEVIPMIFRGRPIEFLPVLAYPEEQVHVAAKRLVQSITAQYLLGLLRYVWRIKRCIGRNSASIEIERFEFALVPLLLNRPALQVIHGEGSRDDKMDSLIKRYWFLHRANEWVAIHLARTIVCVNENIKKRLERISSGPARRAVVMPVPVDVEVFGVKPFDVHDNVMRVVFAGRLDEFKDPPTMFRLLARLHERLNGACEFHYVGTSDPERYAEYALVRSFTVRHGFQNSAAVAGIMARCHVGILTSFFEGMPCFLLELLATGRPLIGIRLPQYDAVVENGVSGAMVERDEVDGEATVEALAASVLELWAGIRDGRISPDVIHEKIVPFSVDRQFTLHFARHREMTGGDQAC